MSRNERHVVPDGDGGWNVVRPGAERSSGHFTNQGEAVNRAREIVRNTGGGEVVIHRPSGVIRDSDTVSPGHYPFPPGDRK